MACIDVLYVYGCSSFVCVRMLFLCMCTYVVTLCTDAVSLCTGFAPLYVHGCCFSVIVQMLFCVFCICTDVVPPYEDVITLYRFGILYSFVCVRMLFLFVCTDVVACMGVPVTLHMSLMFFLTMYTDVVCKCLCGYYFVCVQMFLYVHMLFLCVRMLLLCIWRILEISTIVYI